MTATTSTSPTNDIIVPPVCYSPCNDAYIEAQMVGKADMDSLCDPTTAFQEAYAMCQGCLEANAPDAKTLRTFLSVKFQEWIDLCTGEAPDRTTTRTYQSTLMITDIGGQPVTTMVKTYTTTYVLTSAKTSSSVVASLSLSSTAVSSTLPIEKKIPASESNIWIAGPVVGSISAIILLFLGWWFLRRRRRNKALAPTSENVDPDKENKERFEKAELHADDAPQIPPTELEGSYPDPVPEMSANEIAAQEMLSSELRSPVEMPERQA